MRGKTLWLGSVVWKSVCGIRNAKKKKEVVLRGSPKNIASPRTTRSSKVVKYQDE